MMARSPKPGLAHGCSYLTFNLSQAAYPFMQPVLRRSSILESAFHSEARAAIEERARAVALAQQEHDLRAGDAGERAHYASWGTRVGASLIDGILIIALVVAAVLIGEATSTTNVLVAIAIGVWLLYEPICHAAWQRTLGKAAVGIRIAREVDEGRVGFFRAICRQVVKLFWGLIPLLGLLNLLAPTWDKQRRTWHDAAAGTVVINGRNPGSGT